MSQPPCEVCGCTSYNKVSGYYVCINCDTQSQEIQEQLFEYNEALGNIDDEDREEIVTEDTKKVAPLTSWEYYNFVLKGLISELNDLGASPQLRTVAFQVWASYLQTANAAFFSKQDDKLPLLPLGFKSSDVEILYGIPNLRQKLFKDLLPGRRVPLKRKKESNTDEESDSALSTNSHQSMRQLRVKQRRLALAELTDEALSIDESVISQNETLQSLGKGTKNKKKYMKVAFKSTSHKALKEIMDIVKASKSENDTQRLKKAKGMLLRRMSNYKQRSAWQQTNMTINMTVVISILCISLLLLGDDILLGDIMRWIYEGRLSTNQLDKFIPEERIVRNKFDIQLSNRMGCEVDIRNVTQLLGINEIPTPDLYKLAERYCKDLCLPAEFTSYVYGLMNVFQPKMNYADFDYRVYPNYEGRVLAFILLAFKLLFSLDGVTERKQSLFADYVNSLHSSNPEIPLLFSWTSWVQYIECRKAILTKYDPNVNAHAYGEYIDDKDSFEQFWESTKPSYSIVSNTMSSIFVNTTDKVLQHVNKNIPELKIKFPASLTPNISNLDHLVVNYPYLVPNNALNILKDNFTYHSLLHLLDPEMCQTIAATCNVKVELIDGIASVDVEKYEPEKSALPTISKTTTIPAYHPMQVEMIEDPLKTTKGKTKYNLCQNFDFDYITYVKSDPPEPVQTFKIYNPANEYWFFHETHRAIKHETFTKLATTNFSDSFLWLLKELANMIKSETKDVYLELHHVESVLYSLFMQGEYEQRCSLALYPKEW